MEEWQFCINKLANLLGRKCLSIDGFTALFVIIAAKNEWIKRQDREKKEKQKKKKLKVALFWLPAIDYALQLHVS